MIASFTGTSTPNVNKGCASVKRTYIVYIGIAVVFIGSVIALYLNPFNEHITLIAGIPLVLSVIAGLFKMVNDDAAHSRELIIQSAQNRFSLGASSHMANVAFNKHVAFVEEYATEAFETLDTLFKNGPTAEVIRHTGRLYTLHQKYAVWLTPALEKELEPFEQALRDIGAMAGYVYSGANGSDRQEKLNEMYQRFAEVMGLETWAGKDVTDEVAVTALIRRLRSILGTEELTEMRAVIVAKTIADLRGNELPLK